MVSYDSSWSLLYLPSTNSIPPKCPFSFSLPHIDIECISTMIIEECITVPNSDPIEKIYEQLTQKTLEKWTLSRNPHPSKFACWPVSFSFKKYSTFYSFFNLLARCYSGDEWREGRVGASKRKVETSKGKASQKKEENSNEKRDGKTSAPQPGKRETPK